METQRRNYISTIRATVLRLEKSIERDNESIAVLNKMGISQNTFDVKNTQLLNGIAEKQQEILLLNKRMSDLENGLLDDEIKNELMNQRQTAQNKQNIKREKKIALREELEEIKQEQNKIRRKFRSVDRMNPRIYKNEYIKYTRNCGTLPEYKRKALEQMPSNKGYIWRNIWFFGKKRPERNGNLIMFENLKGGILRIHESNEYEIKIYEKKGKNSQRVLISHKRRKLLSLPPSIHF